MSIDTTRVVCIAMQIRAFAGAWQSARRERRLSRGGRSKPSDSIAGKSALGYRGRVRKDRRIEPWVAVSIAWIVPAALAAINQLAQTWLWEGVVANWRDVA